MMHGQTKIKISLLHNRDDKP